MIIRPALAADVSAMTEILNAIVGIGGPTAHEIIKTTEAVRTEYMDGPNELAAVVAEDQGQVIGWQSVGFWQGEAHIGTCVQLGVQAKGIGVQMFALTCDALRSAGIRALIASIRADNAPGLAHYSRISFVDTSFEPDFALPDGRIVGRVPQRFARD